MAVIEVEVFQETIEHHPDPNGGPNALVEFVHGRRLARVTANRTTITARAEVGDETELVSVAYESMLSEKAFQKEWDK